MASNELCIHPMSFTLGSCFFSVANLAANGACTPIITSYFPFCNLANNASLNSEG